MRSFVILLLLSSLSVCLKAQNAAHHIDIVHPPNPRLVDERGVGLGLLIGDNQTYNKRHPEYLIAKPTVLKTEIEGDKTLHLKCYVNSDFINIIASKINAKNVNDYKAYWQSASFVSDKTIDEKNAHEAGFEVSTSNPTLISLYFDLNREKLSGRDFWVFVKDVRSGKIVSKLFLEFIFPKPEPLFFSLDKNLVSLSEIRPNSGMISLSKEDANRNTEDIKKSNLTSSSFYPNSNLPLKLSLAGNRNNLLLQFKTIAVDDDCFLTYELDKHQPQNTPKSLNPLILLKDLKPGKHTLRVWYPDQFENSFLYEFEIKPTLWQSWWFRWALVIALITVASITILSYRLKRQKALLIVENSKRIQLQAQINSLRPQLNPHFMFNALSSIQGLVNKDDKAGANLYISKFGSLLRGVLEQNDKITHPLEVEIKQVEAYLQLEQLRFKFDYRISVDPTINPTEIDFPAMLLQPFLENSVKHGISHLKEKGFIELSFRSLSPDLEVIIVDNGKGFDPENMKKGFGIKLIRDRIAVINELNKEQEISLDLSSKNTGTSVRLMFKNWL